MLINSIHRYQQIILIFLACENYLIKKKEKKREIKYTDVGKSYPTVAIWTQFLTIQTP